MTIVCPVPQCMRIKNGQPFCLRSFRTAEWLPFAYHLRHAHLNHFTLTFTVASTPLLAMTWIVQLPPDTPVTTPPALTLATFVLLL